MMISVPMGFILAGIIGITSAVLIFLLCKKVFKWKGITSGFWGLFLAMFPFTAFIMLNGRVYIVKKNKEVANYMVFGSSEYKMGDGTTIPLNPPMQNCLIVNDTQEDLVLEEVVYGDFDAETTDELILAMETLVIKGTNIEYIFENRPPLVIKTKKSGVITEYWIRTLESYAAEHSLDYGEEEVREVVDAEETPE